MLAEIHADFDLLRASLKTETEAWQRTYAIRGRVFRRVKKTAGTSRNLWKIGPIPGLGAGLFPPIQKVKRKLPSQSEQEHRSDQIRFRAETTKNLSPQKRLTLTPPAREFVESRQSPPSPAPAFSAHRRVARAVAQRSRRFPDWPIAAPARKSLDRAEPDN